MVPKIDLETINRSFRILFENSSLPFGGKRFIFAGDFRQILPVIRRGSPAQVLAATVKYSYLWKDVKTAHMHQNMRATAHAQ